MGYLDRSCIDEDVHGTGDAVEHVEEDAEQQDCGRRVGYKRVQNSPVHNSDKQGGCSCQFLETPR